MLVVPTSRIILLKNPIEMDYNHELTFTSKEAQFNYFYNLPKIECEKATYQRKDNVIRFPTDPNMQDVTYDDLIQYRGGIVRGMSGSPVIQDGKIIGGVRSVSRLNNKIGHISNIDWMLK
jgi:hypothetical protein